VAKTKRKLSNKTAKGLKDLPICIAMVVCDKVIIGEDKVISAIRIIDVLHLVPQPGKSMPEGIVEFQQVSLLTIIKKAGASGRFDMKIFSVDPLGKRSEIGGAEIDFGNEFPETGRNTSEPLRLNWAGAGLYWIELKIDGRLIARTPLRINIVPEQKGKSSKSKKAD